MDRFAPWEPQGICEFSGFKYPLSQLVRNWDGAMVHRSFVDKRNPQDFVRGVPDDQRVPNPRPEAPDTFLSDNEVQPGDL